MSAAICLPTPVPRADRRACPVHHANWKQGGCTAQMPTSIGARLRYTLDRDSELYKQVYRQRTAVERINSQAVALGIERPHLRKRRGDCQSKHAHLCPDQSPLLAAAAATSARN